MKRKGRKYLIMLKRILWQFNNTFAGNIHNNKNWKTL